MSDEQFIREATIALRVQLGGLVGFVAGVGLFTVSWCVSGAILVLASWLIGEIGNAMYLSAKRRWDLGGDW